MNIKILLVVNGSGRDVTPLATQIVEAENIDEMNDVLDTAQRIGVIGHVLNLNAWRCEQSRIIALQRR